MPPPNVLSVILLPLRPASLTHKNLQQRELIHGMHPIGQKINQSIQTCFRQPVRMIYVATV